MLFYGGGKWHVVNAACQNDKFQFAIQLHVQLPYIMAQWKKAVQLKFYPWYGW